MILENDEVQAVGEIRLLRPRQLDLQDLRSRPVLCPSSRALPSAAAGRAGAGCCAASGAMAAANASERRVIRFASSSHGSLRRRCLRSSSRPLCGPVFTRYCRATRCTSAAVTFAMLSARVLIQIRLVVEHRVLREQDRALQRASYTVHETRARAGPRLFDLPVCDRAGLQLLDLLCRSRLRDRRPSCPAGVMPTTLNRPGPRLSPDPADTFVASCFSLTIAS